MVDRALTIRNTLAQFATPYLNDDAITEIAVQREREMWVEKSGQWEKHTIDAMTTTLLNDLATAVAVFNGTDVSDTRPIMAAVLPTGERIQVVVAPVVQVGTVSITIRKPNTVAFSMPSYAATGFFSSIGTTKSVSSDDTALASLKRKGQIAAFLTMAIETGKTIVIAGSTGSGKTAFIRTLMELIPASKRILTIQDVHELSISHPNHVHLFYEPGGVTPTECLRSSLRMKPCRIVVGEIRGSEAMDVLNAAASGHQGTITSLHSKNCATALQRFALMAMQSEQGRGLGYIEIKALIASVVDIVVHIENGPNGRHITDLIYISEVSQ